MRIGLYEHICSGGLALEPLSASLLSEGFGMLQKLSSDFKSAGHNVTVLLDSRLTPFHYKFQADQILEVSSKKQIEDIINNAPDNLDAFYIIAPESNQILYSLVEQVDSSSLLSLNSSSKAISEVTDKAKLYELLKNLKIKTPKTVFFDLNSDLTEVACVIEETIGFPVIFKPSRGTGCGGLSVVRSRNQILGAISKVAKDYSESKVIAQEFIEGVAASVSLIVTNKRALPMSLNMQRVTLESPDGFSSYDGGEVPLDNLLKEQAFALVKKLVEYCDGLRGYVGVDLVITDSSVYVLEINPRLTTSFIGLRKVVNFNLAQAIVDSVVKNELPVSFRSRGYSLFSKMDFSCLKFSCFETLCNMSAVVSPPFPVAEDGSAFGLIETHGATRAHALRELNNVKTKIQKMKCLGEE